MSFTRGHMSMVGATALCVLALMLAGGWLGSTATGSIASAGASGASGTSGVSGASGATGTTGATGCPARQLSYIAAKLPEQSGMVELAAADGSDRHPLVKASGAVLAPGGQMVAVTGPASGGGALAIYSTCGDLVHSDFPASAAVSGVAWAPDASELAAIVTAHPKANNPKSQLVLVNPATGATHTVASGFVSGPSFGPPLSAANGNPEEFAYTNGPDVWFDVVGHAPSRLASGKDPLWGSQGIVFAHPLRKGGYELQTIPDPLLVKLEPASDVLKLGDAWPVALSSDGSHLVAENAACGVLYPQTFDLTSGRMVHQFPASFAPYGITPAGDSILIAGAPPGENCAGRASRIETVPFAGGKPKLIAYGIDPSWADSAAENVVPAQ